ncbi:MAG: DUF4838 domain-containing protein [Bacteroidales bacterium]|nr:DUF4838 domain-containing protein [Bacteroidales bacterium]
MKRIFIILLIAVLMSSCSSTRKSKDVVFSRQGITKYHIIIPAKPTDNELYAAQTLQEYIYKISGAKIPIVNKCRKTHKEEIHIGNTTPNAFLCTQDNTISVQRKGSSLYFNCKDDAYTMYSVIDFMEKYLGVRKFTRDCDYFPIDSNLTLRDFDSYTYTTPNSYRNVNSLFVRKDDNMKRWLKANTTYEMFAYDYYVHTILRICSPHEYFDTHPEYFALVNGERSREQVCWTNEDVFNIVKDNLVMAMIVQPEGKVWSVSQEDNDIVCQCDKCQKLIDEHKSAAAPVIYLVNKIAKEFPDKIISTLAYRFSRKCPENMKIEDNVQIMLCSIEVDRNTTIEEQGEKEGSFGYDLVQWGKAAKNIFLWDYECDFDYYFCPFPNLHTLQPNIQFFVSNNTNQHFQQANCDRGHEFAELKNYLIAKLLWDPNVDFDGTVEEFCRNYYGKASDYVLQYIRDIESTAVKYKHQVVLDIYGSPIRYKDNILTKENLDKWSMLFDKAADAVKEDSVYSLRVAICRIPVDYAVMEIAKTDMYGANGWFEKQGDKWVVRKDMAQKLENMHKACIEYDVTDINEKGLSPEEYYSTTKRMLDADLASNLAFCKKVTADIMPSEQYSSGKLSTLTDGVIGSDDYKMLWLGWWGEDVTLDVDLEQEVNNKEIAISSLCKSSAWILHPKSVECQVSSDNKTFVSLGEIDGDGYNRYAPATKEYKFQSNGNFRYIRFIVKGTKTLPVWHHCYTKPSWVFLDEITVK